MNKYSKPFRELRSLRASRPLLTLGAALLLLTAYQRSSDASLGLPSDIYHLYLISRQIDLPLRTITLFLGNVHIYHNNIDATRRLLEGEQGVRFELNV